jgi:hypothetical protein
MVDRKEEEEREKLEGKIITKKNGEGRKKRR